MRVITTCAIGALFMLAIAYIPVEGTDGQLFIFAFMNLSTADSGRKGFQQVLISGAEDANVRALIPGANITSFISLNAANNHQFRVTIPADMGMPKGSQIVKIGLMVSSDKPVSVQASKTQEGSMDGYLALPMTENSTEFFVPSSQGVNKGHSLFGIISLKEGTCAEVFRVHNNGVYERLWFLGLDELDVFQALSNTEDYSGIYINSTKPIAVVAGNECAQIPNGTPYCDHMVVQVPPVMDWGKEYIVGGIDGRSRSAGYYIRIYGSEDSTQVTATIDLGTPNVFEMPAADTFSGSVNTGQFLELRAMDTLAVVIVTCTKSCMVVQHNPSHDITSPENSDTDPFANIVPAFHNYKHEFTFGLAQYYYENSTNQFFAEDAVSYVTIVSKSDVTAGITLDGQGLGSNWNVITRRLDFSVTTLAVPPGFHVVSHPDNAASFTVFVYGHGGNRINTGYGYMGGWKSQLMPVPGDYYDITALEAAFKGTGGGAGGSGSGGGGGDGGGGSPATTAPPTPANNVWLSQVTDAELQMSVYAILLRAKFTAKDRSGKLIERKCAEHLQARLNSKRLPDMTTRLNGGIITSKCPGLQIKANLTNGFLYSEYSRGYIFAQLELNGDRQVTFRNLSNCGTNLEDYVKLIGNWPLGGDSQFLDTKNNENIKDCDAVVVENLQWEIKNSGWKCESMEGGAVFASAPSLSSGIGLILCILPLMFGKIHI